MSAIESGGISDFQGEFWVLAVAPNSGNALFLESLLAQARHCRMSGSKHTRFSQKDANHDEVKGWYEALFVHVVDTHTLGFGFPDFVISCSGVWDLVEVKTAEGEPTPPQLRFIRDAKARVTIVRDQQDVVEHVQRIRTKQAKF